jgi:hypothetical protein
VGEQLLRDHLDGEVQVVDQALVEGRCHRRCERHVERQASLLVRLGPCARSAGGAGARELGDTV